MNFKKLLILSFAMIFALQKTIQASEPSNNTPPPPPVPNSSSIGLNGFLITIAAGVTCGVINKVLEYCFDSALGNLEERKAERILQQEKVALSHITLIHEFCKDDTHKETCEQLKKMYLESQLQKKKSDTNS